jgi:MSHA biogenesis protein MshQ
MTFADTGFIISAPDLIANKPGGPVTIQAVKAADNSINCTPAFSGARTVNFWSGYNDPNSGSMQVALGGTNIATSSPGTGIALTFDSNAQASIASIKYSDAGQLSLNARFDGSGNEAGLALAGNKLFVSRPAGLCVESPDDNADCASGDHTCSVFKKAGETFRLTVKGVAWQADSDTDLCAGNAVTPNYRQSGIVLGQTLVAPAGGSSGGIGLNSLDLAATDSGSKTANQTISEVGVFHFTATPPTNGYFSFSVPAGASANIGRFIPANFLLSHNNVTPACNNSFTYAGFATSKLGQPFAVTGNVTARNLTGATTANYTGPFAKLTKDKITALPRTGGTAATGTLSWLVDSLSFTNGVGPFAVNAARYAFTSSSAPQSIYPQITATDDDGVTGNVEELTKATAYRLGRLHLTDSHGPESAALAMPLQAEFFDGSKYVVNTADGCTALNLTSHIGLSINDGSTWVNGATAVAVGNGTTSASLANSPLAAGDAKLSFTAPGQGKTGKVKVRTGISTTSPWLQYDWNGDGSHGEESEATATFGLNRGNKRIMNWREITR